MVVFEVRGHVVSLILEEEKKKNTAHFRVDGGVGVHVGNLH